MGFIGIYRDLSGMIGIWGEWGDWGLFHGVEAGCVAYYPDYVAFV